MSTLKFSDGMSFNTDTPIHLETRSDGLYIVGNGMLIPVNSMEEANKYLNQKP